MGWCAGEAVRTAVITAAGAGQPAFHFVVMTVRLPEGVYVLQAYQRDLYEVKTLDVTICHEDVLVLDTFLADDTLKFASEAEASAYLIRRLVSRLRNTAQFAARSDGIS
jgi:hypothetical protein